MNKELIDVTRNLANIREKEEEMYIALAELIEHINSTYQDKYESSKQLLDTKNQLYHPVRGSAINTYQICRYIQRFMSEGHMKSGNKNDLKKVCHYALFDIVRMNKMNLDKDIDIVDK